MLVFAENKRRFLAAAALVVALVALGFMIGQATGSSSPTAQAAPTPTQVAALGSLRGQMAATERQLAAARGTVRTMSTAVTVESHREARLTKVASGAGARLW
jgi:hypothetical protein